MGKRLSQLYYIKMKTSYDLGFIAIGVAVERNDAITFFYLSLCFSVLEVVLRNRLREYTCHNCLNYGKVGTNSMREFWKYFETKF